MRAEVISEEQQQAEIVAELMLLGAEHVAANVLQCWRDEVFGDPRQHRRRCRSASCLSCRRPPLVAWWRSYVAWSFDQGRTSFFCLPLADSLAELPLVAKALRNLRDRHAREESWLFEDLAFFGIQQWHRGACRRIASRIGRAQIQKRLHVLWPKIVLEDVPTAPSFELSSQMLAALSATRRGFQPARFAILPRATG